MLIALGDKSNHVAALHLPQMLYIWPLIAFFSWPLLYPHVIAAFVPSSILPGWLHAFQPKYPPAHSKEIGLSHRRIVVFIRFLLAAAMTVIALLVIRYNTIIHPFTLADNRHYVFYVFRLLLRHPMIRYLAAPVYIFCGWAALQALCEPCAPRTSSAEDVDMPVEQVSSDPQARLGERKKATPSHDATRVSYLLAWLLTTTLTLVTAPLVEPRYFILPWITWRLAIPSPNLKTLKEIDDEVRALETEYRAEEETAAHDQASSVVEEVAAQNETHGAHLKVRKRGKTGPSSNKGVVASDGSATADASRAVARHQPGIIGVLSHGDHRLWLETAWYLLTNAVTGYTFLYRGFEWPQEPGKAQRFMW